MAATIGIAPDLATPQLRFLKHLLSFTKTLFSSTQQETNQTTPP
ncbi:hypothetical protein [Rubritalea tangerina]